MPSKSHFLYGYSDNGTIERETQEAMDLLKGRDINFTYIPTCRDIDAGGGLGQMMPCLVVGASDIEGLDQIRAYVLQPYS